LDTFPIPPLALHDPNFTQLPDTKSVTTLRVDEYRQLFSRITAQSGSTVTIVGYNSTTDSMVPVSVDEGGNVNVNPQSSSVSTPYGKCTNNSSTGQISFNDTSFSILDQITVPVNKTMEINSFIAAADIQAQVELVSIENTNNNYEVVGLVTETVPVFNPSFGGKPIKVTTNSASEKTIVLRIKALRKFRPGNGSGRIFANLGSI
jgi:hypothetical protein